jgi:ATP-dependent RNA helicase SUPV3L1/SUV3
LQNRPPRGPGRPDDRRGPRPKKRPEARRDGGHERREKQPDPNSPFAKLLALKAQLEDSKK